MNRFTPGPWAIRAEPNVSNGYRCYKIGQREGIVNVGGFQHWHDDPSGEANSDLIVAAPELYAALQDAVGMLSALLAQKTIAGSAYLALVSKGQSALARADGTVW